MDYDGCECNYPVDINFTNRYHEKIKKVDCLFSSICYQTENGVGCQDSDAARLVVKLKMNVQFH